MTDRIQGTDGIRRMVRLSTHPSLAGLSPVEAFLEKDVITEKFVELYTYSYVRDLIDRARMNFGESVVLGWDPRDKEGLFTMAARRGVRKAGGKALIAGTVPTPLIPLYMIYKGAKGGIMLTASHNPSDQNGIKLFIADSGLKPLPFADQILTGRLLDTKDRYNEDFNGPREEDKRTEAIECFSRFSLDPGNSWIERDGLFGDTILVVDPANGSYSGLAAELFIKSGFRVIEVNGDTSSEVNRDSGVVELEGIASIYPELIEKGGKFAGNRAISEIFAIGRENKGEILEGSKRVCGAVFDADGDRYIRLDYDPFLDRIIVLSGDEVAFHQAAYLMEKEPERYKGTAFVNTVESDLNAAIEAKIIGYRPVLTGVGDKWILLEAAIAMLEAAGMEDNEIDKLRKKVDLSGEEIADFLKQSVIRREDIRYCIGAEESGHIITAGYLRKEDGNEVPFFCGNGFKSAINCLVATDHFYRTLGSREYFHRLERPFTPGFKKTYYVFYTDHSGMTSGTPFRQEIELEMRKVLNRLFQGFKIAAVERREEPEMLYLSIIEGEQVRACVYVRNSGTEDKTGINLRGIREDSKKLIEAGESIRRFLLEKMKDRKKTYASAEALILNILSESGGKAGRELFERVEGVSVLRLLKEMEKGGLIDSPEGIVTISPLGEWYLGKVGRLNAKL